MNDLNIFLLMGQSNMVGRALLAEVEPLTHPHIRAFKHESWQPAEEPLHDNKEGLGTGLGMTFALELLKHDESVDIGLIPCAEGGTRLERWEPGADLYSRALRMAGAARSGGTVKGILWHQGEGDARSAELADTYFDRFTAMIGALRRDLGGKGPVPVIIGELGRFLGGHEESETLFVGCRTVNDALKQAAQTLPAAGFASSEDLEDKGDNVHFNSVSLREFGRRYGREFLAVAKREGIELENR